MTESQREKTMLKPAHWTDEQWAAITRRGNNLLVAAAAGSGKTSVLVERIIRRITDTHEPVGVDELLVVTFTNAAAAEMRQRIGEALRKELEAQPQSAHLRRQLAYLQRASITTIHSFCLELLRQYYYLVELNPDFRIADEMEAELLRQDVLEAKLEAWYESDSEFQALADIMLDGQDDLPLAALITKIYDFSRSHPKPFRWLQEMADMFQVADGTPISSLPWARSILRKLRLEVKGAVAMHRQALELAQSPEGPAAYAPHLEQECAMLQQACEAVREGWEALGGALRQTVFAKLPPVKDADPTVKEQVQQLRNTVKKKVEKWLEEYFLTEPDQYRYALQQMAPHMQTLARLVQEYGEAYHQEKRARGVVDFSDLEHLALRLLAEDDAEDHVRPSEIARQLQERFAEVLVDEYQDTNLVQETILQMVSRSGGAGTSGNRFMVGDVKQSIYRFRLAEPHLFLDKYMNYAPVEGDDPAVNGWTIDLAANFRSRREVVDAVNYLFRRIMTPGVGEIAYDERAELICRAAYPEVESERLQVEVHLIDRRLPDEEAGAGGDDDAELEGGAKVHGIMEQQEELSAAQMEARLIARRIRRWMQPGEGEAPLLVYDKKQGGLRPVAYRDIVILLRATSTWGPVLQEELRAAGIPVFAEQSGGYFAAPEVELMLSLLRVIDNPLQDIPLAAVLRSPIGHLRDEELAHIRILTPKGPFYQAARLYADGLEGAHEGIRQKLRAFYRRLDQWRTQARTGSLADLIARIYRETGYLDYVTGMENGQQRLANLRILYDRARQYEAGAYRGLFRFLRFIDRLQQAGSDLGEARTIGEGEDVVRIMTIHKSKGLEFPVVFVAGLGKAFNTMDMKASFLLHKELGFGPYAVDAGLRLRYPTLAMLGIREQLRLEMLAEEMRVLYVALTRAREKLILTGTCKDLAKSIVEWGSSPGDGDVLDDNELIQAKGYLDWIGRSLLRHPKAAALRAYPVEQGVLAEPPRLSEIPDDSVWAFAFYKAADWAEQVEAERVLENQWGLLVRREPVPDRPTDERWRDVIRHALTWSDPYREVSQMAAKWTVSELKQLMRDDAARPMQLPPIVEKPRFLSAERPGRFTAAELGTIMHTVMQHIDVRQTGDEADVKAQINQLVTKEYLTPEQAAAVPVSQIAAFFRSDLGNRMKQAPRIYRELPFTLAVPAAEIGQSFTGAESELVIVQGVIDCLLEEADGRLVLLDFKSDAIGAEASPAAIARIRQRYEGQVRFYVRAVREIWGREVAESYLYLFAGSYAIPVSG